MPSKRPVIMTYTDKETVEKFKIVAKSNDRTMSKQLEHIIKESIKNYETQNGNITVKQVNVESNSGNININQ